MPRHHALVNKAALTDPKDFTGQFGDLIQHPSCSAWQIFVPLYSSSCSIAEHPTLRKFT